VEGFDKLSPNGFFTDTMTPTLTQAFVRGFLGQSPLWYKLAIAAFLVGNPLVLASSGYNGPLILSWLILFEFIFTLAMALKCHPLQPGGLLAIEAVLLELVSPASAYHEIVGALPMLLLLIFMLAGIYFIKDLLLYAFTRLLLGVRSQLALSLLMFLMAGLLAAFLNVITVIAAIVTMALGFYQVYHKVASGKPAEHEHNPAQDTDVQELHRSDLDAFRGFLRGMVMNATIGAVVGGAFTPVGQPQNVLIAEHAHWDFIEFVRAMTPVLVPMVIAALGVGLLLHWFRWFGYGLPLPVSAREVLMQVHASEQTKHNARDRSARIVQALAAAVLVAALVTQAAHVGIVGLLTIILVTSFTGITEEHRIGRAFTEAMPFTALVVVFFVIVAMLREQHTFEPLLSRVLALEGSAQAAAFYAANGVLSAISDNVFVATIFTTEIKAALLEGAIGQEQFHALAIATNVGAGVPSIATPNGQAALLLLLTSALAPLIRLSYGRMVWMALPYAVVLFVVGWVAMLGD
jgi:NhaB family Na+:H+ antiporter